MAEHDFLDSILNDIGAGAGKTQKSSSDEFLLDDILKEFGVLDDASPDRPKRAPEKKAPVRTAQEAAPAAATAKAAPETTEAAHVRRAQHAPAQVHKATETPAADKDISVLFGQQPESGKPAQAADGEPASEPAEGEQGDLSIAALFASSINSKREKQAHASAGAAPITAEVQEAMSNLPVILTEDEEENFKMRSGYIDLAAVREATAAKFPEPAVKKQISKVMEKTAVPKPSISKEQQALFNKIGNFFASDATFQYDTSSVNGLTKQTGTGGKKKRARKTAESAEVIPEVYDESIEDIYEVEDIPEIEQDLLYQTSLSATKAIITAILAIPLALLNLFPAFTGSVISAVSIDNPFNYAVANLALLLIIGIINYNIIFRGIAGLFTLQPTGSSLSALAWLGTVAHCIYVMVTTPQITAMYSFVSALSIVFVLVGKHIYYKNVYKNFEILAFDAPKAACVDIPGGYSLKELYSNKQKVSSCRPVSLITRFLNNSFDNNFADTLSKYSILAAVCLMVIAVVVSALTGGAAAVFPTFAAALCMIAPFCYDIAYSLPLRAISGRIRRSGSAVVSYSKAQSFSKTSTLVVCDNDLFRPENIVVHSMKINGNDKINDVIINSASLIHASGSPVAGAFLSILDNKHEMLMPVRDFDWVPGKGYSGVINNTKYFVGSSQYLIDCGIKLPTVDLEEKYRRAGRQVIMFADSYKLMAVFSISYKPNKMIYNNLRKINPDHFEMMILTRDYNITSDLLAELYDADPHNFKIANKEEFERLYHHDEVKDKYPAGIYSITGAGGITAALANCRRLITSVKASVIIRTVALLLGAVVFLALTVLTQNTATVFAPVKMLFFHCLWILPALFISIFSGS